MTQNLKIVLNETRNQYPNNINFSDTITIKANSKIALTSFNASFDINKQGKLLENQSFDLYANFISSVNLDPITIHLPNRTYYHQAELDYKLYEIINFALSAYINTVDITLRENLIGKVFSISKKDDKTILSINTIALEQFSYPSPDPAFTIDENGFYTTEDETAELLLALPVALSTEPSLILMKGGGVAYQYGLTFNFNNATLSSYMELSDNKNDYMRLYYKIIRTGNINPLTQEVVDKKTMLFYVQIKKNDVITVHHIRDDFYDWGTFTEEGESNGDGPWGNNSTANNNYFMWYQKNGRWHIVYKDNVLNKYEMVFENGLEYEINSNYKFTKVITQAKSKNCNFNALLNRATFQTKLTGNASISTKIDFNNCDELLQIYGFTTQALFIPSNSPSSAYEPNKDTNLFPIQNFEIACEIDTIKIKNYVGNSTTEGNRQNGRKNIIAYFTPSTTISGNKFIFSYDPSNPIYLTVDSSTDIDMNSMGIRFYNSYSGAGLNVDSISALITNVIA